MLYCSIMEHKIQAQCHGIKGPKIDGSFEVKFDLFPIDLDKIQLLLPIFAEEAVVELSVKVIGLKSTSG